MRKPSIFLLLSLAVVLTLLFLTASVIEHEDHHKTPSITADNCEITTDLDAVAELSVTPHLIAQFYNYYREHHYELTYLPEFSADNNEPDWDALSLYILLRYEPDENDPEEALFTQEKFRETMQKHMLPVVYTDGPSRYMLYENGVYTAPGFDLIYSEDYRLISLTRDDQGVYTAAFDILHFDEAETAFPETSPNTRTIVDYAVQQFHYTEEEVLSSGPKFHQAIEAIFLEENYASVLDMAGRVTVQFTLTGEETSPFYYISCARHQ